MVATLKGSVGKMNELLARLAPTPDQRAAKPEPTELRPLVASAIAANRRDREVMMLGDGNLTAMADPLLLEQAIGHLVLNAVDASKPGQPVTVRMDGDEDRVMIVVTDVGTGMDAEFIRTRLFQPFASTKESGFGLGAYEAHALLAAMSGRLEVESLVGEGTKFTLFLPGAVVEPMPSYERKIA